MIEVSFEIGGVIVKPNKAKDTLEKLCFKGFKITLNKL